ncbi:DUF262 domain-containing protein [Lysinibacillus sp. FSL K6-0232]|uniref:DUF262 domain-containing protein n=1 Tax=unclassified Lysinibacillus TaxID=2636778 RepID=UPI0030F4E064
MMGLIEEELSVVSLENLLGLQLSIPEYQRPYRWHVSSTNTLFMDTYEAYRKGLAEYRIGSVILHKKKQHYYIVDGQQRITTLSILLYCLGDTNDGLLNEQYSSLSTNAIIYNFELLSKKISELEPKERLAYKSYLLEKCTVVKIVTDNEQEAFQFFDSQNCRGKELAPHDLLKSYHLREMNLEDEHTKIKIINSWENKNQQALEDLFKNYLFPVTQWYKKKDGLGYSSDKIATFKGIKLRSPYNYAIYQKASNLFIEQTNTNGSIELLANQPLNQFQLTQPVLAGKRFFNYTLHYAELLEKVQNKIMDFHNKDQIPDVRSGDIYIKQLYESALLFFADRFGLEFITDTVIKQLYTWCYSLRLVMTAVYPQTINKYACGNHERINYGLDLFTKLSEMNEPEELAFVIFESINKEDVSANLKKYSEIWNFLYG